MRDLANRAVIGIGELLWDLFPGQRRPGGAPANVAFHAAQLGHRGLIASRVGDDELGRELIDELRRHGLSTELIQVDRERPTGRVTVDSSDPAQPAYTIHDDVAWDALEFDASLEAAVGDAAAICVGSLAQRSDASRSTIARCLEAAPGALRVFDVNLRPGGYRRDWVEGTLRHAQVVKLNDKEVTELAAMFDIPPEPERFGRALLGKYGVELVCVTRAERGCLLVTDVAIVDVPGTPVEVADAVGAGDAFTAALISARLRGLPLEAAARLANSVGALVASREGAMPDLGEELSALMAEAG